MRSLALTNCSKIFWLSGPFDLLLDIFLFIVERKGKVFKDNDVFSQPGYGLEFAYYIFESGGNKLQRSRKLVV